MIIEDDRNRNVKDPLFKTFTIDEREDAERIIAETRSAMEKKGLTLKMDAGRVEKEMVLVEHLWNWRGEQDDADEDD